MDVVKTPSLSELLRSKRAASMGQSGLLSIDEVALYTALVREAAYSLIQKSTDGLYCILDGETAGEIDSLSNVVMRADGCVVFGSLPEAWTLEAFPEVQQVEVSSRSSEHFFVAVSSVGSVAIQWSGSMGGSSLDFTSTGLWTAYRPLVMEVAESLLGEQGISIPAWPDVHDPDAAQRMLMALMHRVVELYEVRQLHVLKDLNDLSAVLEILKSLSARQSSHDIMYTFVRQIAKHVGIDRCSLVRADIANNAASVLVSHEDKTVRDISIDLEK